MRPRVGRIGIVAAAAVVQLAVLVLAHDLVYLARYGSRYGEALVHAGHGGAWRAAVASAIVLGGLAALVVVARLVRLQLLLRRERATGNPAALDLGTFVRTWTRVGPALAISTAALLTLQENLEQRAASGASSGIGILLTPEYAGGLWIALVIGLLVGVVVALLAWRLRMLEARLRAARVAAVHPHRQAVARRAANIHRPDASILGRRCALRAPPSGLPAS